MLKILFTGGGSGGHIYPLVSVAEELYAAADVANQELTIDYLGAYGEFGTVLTNYNVAIYSVVGGKIRNYFSWLNFIDIFRIGYAFCQAFFRLYFLMPDVVFSKGGTGALPVVIAARFYLIPVIIHESDAIPGKANKMSAWFATRIAISFAGAFKYFDKRKTALVGNPIRKEFFTDPKETRAARVELGFLSDLPLILILGSSQGARALNDFIFGVVTLLTHDNQLLHQVGIKNMGEADAEASKIIDLLPSEEKERYKIVPFLDEDYVNAMQAADVIVSRASSGSIFEIAASHKPSILIPLPESARDHQRENAYAYASTGAATIVEQENLLPSIFLGQLQKILKNEAVTKSMSLATRGFARPNAAKLIAEEIIKLGL